jgi:prepilin-type N-terminal cleavage/methylation domain-containing protein
MAPTIRSRRPRQGFAPGFAPGFALGFTLVELLVVITIIGVLVSLLLPAIQASREAARRTTCLNRIRQVGVACLNYESATGHFPPANDALHPNSTPPTRPDYCWIAFILPYLEQQALYDSINADVDWFHASNEVPATTPLTSFRCPSRPDLEPVNLSGPGGVSDGFGNRAESDLRTHFLAVLGANTELYRDLPNFCSDPSSPYSMEVQSSGSSRRTVPTCVSGDHGPISNNGILYRYSKTRMGEVEDGTTNTFLVGESAFGDVESQGTRPWIAGAVGSWMYGAKNLAYSINSGARPGPVRNNMGFGSQHPGGCHFAMSDASADFISENVDLKVLFDMAARNDGYVIDASQL